LYKYEAFSTQSLLNLKKQVIYFGSPLKFNDPYDCALTPNIIEPTDAELFEVRDAYLKRHNLTAKARQEFKTLSLPQLREALLRATRAGFQQAVNEFLTNRGVACFSEKNDDLLMWSHYGGRYKGFCLEFDTSSDALQKFHQVRYQPTLPALSIANVLLNQDFDPVRDLFCTKSDAWAYEREWRGLHNVAGTEYGYPASALTGIFFGPDIDIQSLEVVCLILAGQNEAVKLWRGKRSASEFRVLFESFTYTSHLEGKRKNLIK
jgi:hypothetical protein